MPTKIADLGIDEEIERLEHGTITEKACALALRYGTIDGAHHKMWVIDQMLRVLSGAKYNELIMAYRKDGYEWETGTIPSLVNDARTMYNEL